MTEDERVILCLDINSFFLAVHERDDEGLRDVPVALWQYNDVVCANHLARALGVKKHMYPEEARRLITPKGGRMVQIFKGSGDQATRTRAVSNCTP